MYDARGNYTSVNSLECDFARTSAVKSVKYYLICIRIIGNHHLTDVE